MIITLIIMIIAISRQYVLYQHYDTNLCCFCYKQALMNPQDIFEWQTCDYHKNIKDPNTQCQINTSWKNPTNLSTNYDLFSVAWYYIVTASNLCGISLIYAILTFCLTFRLNFVDILLQRLPLEFMLSYNVFISMICFYQISIDYQFFQDSNYVNDDGKRCYVDSLSVKDEDFMFGGLIFAFVYIITSIIIVFTLPCIQHRLSSTVHAMYEKIYNWIFFVFFGIVVLLFLSVFIFYTYHVILAHFTDKSGWAAWLIIIILQILLFMSFVDICNFKIFKYPANPFVIIMKTNGCYRVCYRKHHTRKRTSTFVRILRSESINDTESFIQ